MSDAHMLQFILVISSLI